MLTQVLFADTVGKTIKRAQVNNIVGAVILTFTDDTFAMAAVDECYADDDDSSGQLDEWDYAPSIHTEAMNSVMLEMHVVTREELAALTASLEANRKYRSEIQAREEYARLWMKFGGKPLSEVPPPEPPEPYVPPKNM